MTVPFEEYEAALAHIREVAAMPMEVPDIDWDRYSASGAMDVRLAGLWQAQVDATRLAACVALVQACSGVAVLVTRDGAEEGR